MMELVGDTILEKERSIDLQEIKLLRVEQLYKNGKSIADACKSIGISVHTYYKYRERVKAETSQPRAAEKVASISQESN